MKKSQILASTVLASTLSLAGITTPLVYAVEGDTTTVVDTEVVAKTWSDVTELVNSHDFEAWEKSEAFTQAFEEFMELDAIRKAKYSEAEAEQVNTFWESLFLSQSFSAELKAEALAKNIDKTYQELSDAVKGYNVYNTINPTHGQITESMCPTETEEAKLWYFIKYVDDNTAGSVSAELDMIAALGGDEANIVMSNHENWNADDYMLAARTAYDAQVQQAIFGTDDGVAKITFSEASDGVKAINKLWAYRDAGKQLQAYAAGEDEKGKFYDLWMLLESEGISQDSDEITAHYNALYDLIEELQIPVKPITPEQTKPDQPDPEQPEKPTPEQPEEKPTPEQPSGSEKEPKPTQPDNSDRPSNIVITEVVSGDTSDDKIASPVAAPNTGIVSHTQEVTTSAQSNQTVAIVASILALASATVALITRRCRKEA